MGEQVTVAFVYTTSSQRTVPSCRLCARGHTPHPPSCSYVTAGSLAGCHVNVTLPLAGLLR